MSTESDQIAAECMDAGRTALAILRFLRAGNARDAMALLGTLTPHEHEHVTGAMASLANQAFNVLDDVMQYGRTHGLTELTATSDEVLAVMAIGFANGERH